MSLSDISPLKPEFVDVEWAARSTRTEYAWIGQANERPIIVFLHEGLGSLSLWKDFPQRLCAALGMRGLVFSRWGYGWSSARAANEPFGIDFMHEQAVEFLPSLFAALALETRAHPVWFYGHSDGASIALIHAALRGEYTAGAIVVAPHVFVESVAIESIEAARAAYRKGNLKSSLARHHADTDSAFYGWNDVWLSPEFKAWSIEALLSTITCPVLAIQGWQDAYGTMEQVERVAKAVPHCRLVKLENCGHSPHRDQPERVIAACAAFVAGTINEVR